ncbi:MAG: sensor histidine kinase [Chloroflexota bacterium]
MTGNFYLDWLLLSVSLFDTILLLWLGLTVFLNAERQVDGRSRWGVWLSVGGLLMGALFFVSHTAIVGHEQSPITPGLEFWWRVGWIPIALLPYTWYAIVLWYAGYWEPGPNALRRQRPWFMGVSLLTVFLISTLIFFNPVPSFLAIAAPRFVSHGIRPSDMLWILAYAVYLLLCIGLALDSLRRPGPTARHEAGHAARHRARPWLTATSLVLLLVCLLVAGIVAWGVILLWQSAYRYVTVQMITIVGVLDLIIAGLIGLSIILLGQAVVSYEIFTGKALPRRGLARYWHNAIVLAAGFSVIVGGSFTIHARPIYSILAAALLMTGFYALLTWRSYMERDHLIQSLRPFVTSQQLYERLLTQESEIPALDMAAPFRALCADVLGVRRAALLPMGPLAALAPQALAYPEGISLPAAPATDGFRLAQPLDPAQSDGMAWAIPLGSTRGLIGVLLLGEKQADGPYTQEEIEIARAAAERILDTHASSELARRLMALQRQRLAETQLLDQRTRRLLHDDVLPRLHAALLSLNSDPAAATTSLSEAHRQISDLLRDLPTSSAPNVKRLGLLGALEQVITDELPKAFEEVNWHITPEAEAGLRSLPALASEVLFYAAREAIRNAARHARGGASETTLRLDIRASVTTTQPSQTGADGLLMEIEDNGIGIAAEGQPTGQPAGSGSGLALHSAMLAVVGGTLSIESEAGIFTRVQIQLPKG